MKNNKFKHKYPTKMPLKASALVPGMLQCHGVGVLLSPVQNEGPAHGLDI